MEEEEKERRRVLEEKAKAKEAEKMEAQMLQLSERIRNDMPLTDSEWAAWYRWQALSSSSGRKRKTRKKKKLPRGGRAHRRHRQWQVPRWFPGFDASHAVFPSSVGMPELPGIFAGMYLKDSGVLFVVSGSGMFQAGFAGISPRAVFFSIVAWSQMLRITAFLDQKELLAFLNPGRGMCKACIAGFTPRSVFPLVVGRPAGRSVWTRRTIICLACFAGEDAPRAVPVLCRQAQDARHHGRYDSGEQVPRGVPENRVFLGGDVAEGLSSLLVRPLWGLTGEARSQPGVTVAGGPRGLQGQRAGSDDGRHSFGSCCPEDVAPSGELTHAPADP